MWSRSKQPLVKTTRSLFAFQSATREHEFRAAQDLVLSVKSDLRRKGGQQFVFFDGHCAYLAHYNAGGNVGELHGRLRAERAGQAQGQNRNHSISGSGNVIDLASYCGSDEDLANTHQSDAFIAEGSREEFEIEFLHHRFGRTEHAFDTMHTTSFILRQRGSDLGQIGADCGGAAITRKIGALGVHEHRNAKLASRLNQHLADFGRKRSFRVVREHQGMATGELGKHALDQAVIVALGSWIVPLAVKAQHLLLAAQDARLHGRGKAFADDELRSDSIVPQARVQQLLVLVPAGKADDPCLRAQEGQIHGHVGCAARPSTFVGHSNHRHRRLRRDAPHLAPDVPVEHYVAGHQQALAGPGVLNLANYLMQLFDHRGSTAAHPYSSYKIPLRNGPGKLEPVINFRVACAGSQFFRYQGARSDGYRESPSDERQRDRKNWPQPSGLRRKSGAPSDRSWSLGWKSGAPVSEPIFARNAGRGKVNNRL